MTNVKNTKIKRLYNFLVIIMVICTIWLMYIAFKTKKENQKLFNEIKESISLQNKIQDNPNLEKKIIKINKIIKENNIKLERVDITEIARILSDDLIDIMEKNIRNIELIKQWKYITIRENWKDLLSYLISLKEKDKKKQVKWIKPPEWSQINLDLK